MSRMMHRRGFSLIKTVIGVFVLISLTSIGLHTVFSWVPVSLQDVEGVNPSEDAVVVDLKERLQQALDKSYEVTISEEELNLYIAERLKLTQSAIVDDYITIKGVYVDLQPGAMEVIIEREIDYDRNVKDDGSKQFSFLPLTQTISLSMEVSVSTAENGDVSTTVSFPGAKFGQSPAPGGLVAVVKPSFDVIAKFFEQEIKLGYNNQTSVKIEDGVMTIDPRPLTEIQ